MKINTTPWESGTGGIICLPLRKNIPVPSNPDWQPVICPNCGRECWKSELARKVIAIGAVGICTECALRTGPKRPHT